MFIIFHVPSTGSIAYVFSAVLLLLVLSSIFSNQLLLVLDSFIRARLRPLPPPPPLPPAGSLSKSASPFETSSVKDGDSNLDGAKSGMFLSRRKCVITAESLPMSYGFACWDSRICM